MLVDATLLIQDVQLLCFTVIFGVLAYQRWHDATRRWLWFGFLANAAGAVFDLSVNHLPNWIGHGVNPAMIPLSYALTNVAFVYFERRGRLAIWISAIILLMALPMFFAWDNDPHQMRTYAVADAAIALESIVTVTILFIGTERSTRAPRLLMGAFLSAFAAIELTRTSIAFFLHTDPDIFSKNLELISAVAYIVNTSLLPLAFIWMMNARLESDLLQQSICDPLTKILNRRGLEQRLEQELAQYRRYSRDFTVAVLDLDHFKKVNDAYGHAVGDSVLMAVADLLRRLLRESDFVGRFGGEEFVLVFPQTTARDSRPIVNRFCQAVRETCTLLPHPLDSPTASLGATNTGGRQPLEVAQLLREADIALYRAKQGGRDQALFFDPADPSEQSLAQPVSNHFQTRKKEL